MAGQDQLEGSCNFWNAYFIAQSAALLTLIAFNGVLTFSRGRRPQPCDANWGRPWSICIFLFSIGVWNLTPLCLFFILFYAAMPATFRESERMTCLTIENIPFLTAFFVLLGLQILFGYSAKAARAASTHLLANDNDLLVGEAEQQQQQHAEEGGAEQPATKNNNNKHRVVMLQANGRGNFLIDRLRNRREYLKTTGATGSTYVAHTSVVLYPYPGYELERDHLLNNMHAAPGEEEFVPGETYFSVHESHAVSNDNVFGLPFRNNSIDKVILSPNIRLAPPIAASFMTPEERKTSRMRFVLREALRVLKPGGKIVFVNSASDAILCYADLRDLVGESNVTVKEGVGSFGFLMMKNVLFQVTATKAEDYAAPEASVSVLQQVPTQLQLRDEGKDEIFSSPLITDPNDPVLNEGAILSVMLPIQTLLFFGLLFGAAALYAELDWPSMIPVSQRVGNLPIGVAMSYPLFAYFEREVALTGTHFKSRGALLRFMSVSTGLTLLSSVLLTALLGLPQLGIQVALASTSLDATVRSLLGYAISALIGVGVYKYSKHQRISATLKNRGLSEEYKKYFR